MFDVATVFTTLLQLLSLAQMPKKGVNARKCEIVRFYKLHTMKDVVEPLSMIVPRKVNTLHTFMLQCFR